MRTERKLRVLVVDRAERTDRSGAGAPRPSAEPSWQMRRTLRAVTRIGLESVVAHDGAALAGAMRACDAAGDAAWLLEAGAVPLHAPSIPAPSATGRSLVAFGAVFGDAPWAALLAATGGDLTGGAAEGSGSASIRSVFVERPGIFAAAAGELFERAMWSDPRVRAVRIPTFDVAFTEVPHVLELVTTLHRGGAERIVLDLARELDVLGFDVTLAVLDRASRTTFDAPEGTVFLDALARERPARLAALAELATARGVDLIHAHLLNGDDLRALGAATIPVVTTIHNSRPGWPIRLETLREGDVALMIACSRDVERQLIEAQLPAPVRTIWNGIARANANANANANADAGATASTEKRVRMLAVANHRPQKRLERLPGVVAELRSRGYEARVVVVGEPVKSDPDMLAIEGAVRAESRRCGVEDGVELVGSRADVRSMYSACDVVVSTSAFEGLSLVHCEALAAGVPLVTTAVAGTDELARKHAHAHVVPLDASAATLADAVLAATAERRSAEAAAPNGLALDFTAGKMAERHADLFARLIVARGAPVAPRSRRAGVVLIANNFSTGGAQSSARRMLLAFAAAGVPVRAVVLQEQAAFPTPGRTALAAAGIEVFVAPRAGDVDPLVTAREIARFVDSADPEAVVFWNVISQHKVLVADLLFDTPIWDVSPGEMYFASFERYLSKPRVGSPYLTMSDYGRRLSGVIVKYEAERAHAAEMLGGIPVHVVPNGVVVPERIPARPHPGASSARGERVVVGTLARLGVDKKLEQLVDAVAHAASRGLFGSCELRIAGATERGDEAYVASLRERSRDLPIAWVGEQDASTFLAELDVFAMVSEPCGCPNASLEAMAAGLAVVATDAGGARDQILHAKTGLLVPRGDGRALGEAIAELAADPGRRAAMGEAGHARAREKFDVRRMARDYARLWLTAVPPALEARGLELPEPRLPGRDLVREGAGAVG